MKYAELIDGYPQFAPNPIRVGQTRIGNPPGAVYTAQGYKPVVFAEMPEVPAGYDCAAVWTETAEAIVQSWTLTERTELDGEEAMQMLFGGES